MIPHLTDSAATEPTEPIHIVGEDRSTRISIATPTLAAPKTRTH